VREAVRQEEKPINRVRKAVGEAVRLSKAKAFNKQYYMDLIVKSIKGQRINNCPI